VGDKDFVLKLSKMTNHGIMGGGHKEMQCFSLFEIG